MKLQLDLDNKIIRIEQTVNLSELYDVLKKLLPQGEWKDFSIETNTTINWIEPIIIRNPTIPYIPTSPWTPINPYPWWVHPFVTYNNSNYDIKYAIGTGTYNIEM